MTKKAKKAVAITMLSIILIGLAFCISALAVSSVNGTTFTATVTEWWGVVVKAFNGNSNGDNSETVKPQNVSPSDEEKPSDNNQEDNNKDSETPGEEASTSVCYDDNGNLLKSGVNYAFQSSLNFAEASASASDGITMTATIIPSSALDKRINWTVEWVDSSSEWASGKTVTDYVTVTADSSDSRVATVNCLAPFGSQIKVVATSVANEEAKANCFVDYYKKGDDITMEFVAKYIVCATSGYPNEAEVLSEAVYEDIFTRIDKNQYAMRYLDISDMETPYVCIYGVSYTENYVDNSIGTKEGLKDISLKSCEVTPLFTGKQLNVQSGHKAKNLFGKTEKTNLNTCRLDMVTETTATATKRDGHGPTIDSLNIVDCLGFALEDEYYDEMAKAILNTTESGGFHYEFTLEATDILTGELKEIIINVRLDDSFIPKAMRVELSEYNIEY